MPDQIQLRGGTAADNDGFTGVNREVTVDTTNKTLRVHDGVAVGGHPLIQGTASSTADADTIALRDAWGRLQVADPQDAQDATSKSYVDGAIADSGLAEIVVFELTGDFVKADYPNLRYVVVKVLGGGGGGGGAGSNTSVAQGGKGAGLAIKRIAASALGATETATVGAAGSGGASGDNAGTDGGTSSFGAHCSATGGGGGLASNVTGTVGGFGVGSGGDINLSGGMTDEATTTSAKVQTRGGDAAGGFGLGGFGLPDVLNNPGRAGTGFGAGGSGASRNNSSRNGGDGTPGLVIVEIYR